MEASRRIRPHEANKIVVDAEQAKRLAPHISHYHRALGELADRGMVLGNPENPEMDFKMSITDGVPILQGHDFLGDEPPYGDPL